MYQVRDNGAFILFIQTKYNTIIHYFKSSSIMVLTDLDYAEFSMKTY